MDLKEYRMVEGIGNHWNRRREIQEKYKYFENVEWIEAWHMIFGVVIKQDVKKCLRNIKN